MTDVQTITLGGGCFWCLEAVYDEMEGVESVSSGYMGGQTPQPTYEQVCGGRTGHAEVVQVLFDAKITSVRDILEVFFAIHDPTTRNRQGNDIGTQYRSVIFYHSDEQRQVAQHLLKEMEADKVWSDPVVTELLPATVFHPAEEYHRDYFRRNPQQTYCSYVVAPKVIKFRQKFAAKRKTSPA